MTFPFIVTGKNARCLTIAGTLAMFLTGCSSITPNNSAILLNQAETPKLASALVAEPLPSSASLYGQSAAAAPAESASAADEPANGEVLDVHDPREKWNRKFTAFNIGFDKVLIRPVSHVYGAVVPPPVRLAVKNLLRYFETPGDLVNYSLQGNGKEVKHTLKRFAINTTLGLGGVFDVAQFMDLPYNPTDFGLTLASYGVKEGKYLVLPVLGPSTTRDSLGRFADIAFRPQTYIGLYTDFNYGNVISQGTEAIDRRFRNGDLIDDVIFASPDPYITLRSTYLQRRRALVAGTADDNSNADVALPVISTAGQ